MEAMMLRLPGREERRCGGKNGVEMGMAGPPIADLAKWPRWRLRAYVFFSSIVTAY